VIWTKPKVAIFDLTDCEGCEVQILNSKFIERILESVEFLHFRFGQRVNRWEEFDVAFIEGAVITSHELGLVKKIREYSKLVVALGSCACFGGIAALNNFIGIEEAKKYVYGENADKIEILYIKPLSEIIRVDFMLRGCPIAPEDFERLVSDLLAGRISREHTRPVCMDCKSKGNPCFLLEGIACAGPVTYGGCGAPCPSAGMPCDGCRGPLEEPQMSAELELLKKIASKDDVIRLFRKFAPLAPLFREAGGEDR
jgi:coenzyme F420-reducing hydrogenase gamma subunit